MYRSTIKTYLLYAHVHAREKEPMSSISRRVIPTASRSAGEGRQRSTSSARDDEMILGCSHVHISRVVNSLVISVKRRYIYLYICSVLLFIKNNKNIYRKDLIKRVFFKSFPRNDRVVNRVYVIVMLSLLRLCSQLDHTCDHSL